MTKEEFESIFSRQLEELEQELEKTIARIQYEEALWAGSNEAHEAEQRKKLLEKEIEYIKDLIHIPAYERIMAMSETEITAYKEEKRKEIDLKIAELTAKIEVKSKHLESLKQTDDKIALDYTSAKNDYEKEKILSEGKKNRDLISNVKDEISNYESEMSVLKERKEKIDNRSSEEIKSMLISKLTLGKPVEKNYLDFGIAAVSRIDDPSTRLLASVNNNEEKIEALIDALMRLKEIKKNNPSSKRIEINFNNVPDDLKRKINNNIVFIGTSIYDPDDIDKINEIVDQYLKEFNIEDELIKKECTLEKMKPVFDPEMYSYHTNSEEVDFEFLKLHTDKLNEARIEYLKTLIEEKNNLEKKVFKTRKIKQSINEIITDIKTIRDDLYRDIKNWYKYNLFVNIPKTEKISWHPDPNTGDLELFISKINENVETGIYRIEQFKESINKSKERRIADKEAYDAKLSQCEDEILAIVGPEFTRDDIPNLDETPAQIFDRIKYASIINKANNTIKDVKTEAQKQADEKEAELRGITLEQLMQLRAQATAAKEAQEPTNNPSGMTM